MDEEESVADGEMWLRGGMDGKGTDGKGTTSLVPGKARLGRALAPEVRYSSHAIRPSTSDTTQQQSSDANAEPADD